ADASVAVAATSRRTEKVSRLAEVLVALDPAEIVSAVAFLTGTTPLGRVGVGWAAMSETQRTPPDVPTLQINEVDDQIRAIAALDGPGSADARRRALAELFGRATDVERRLLAGLLGGELRQGAGDGVMTTAIADAAGVPVGAVRRAAMLAGELPAAALVAMTEGRAGLDALQLEPGRPVSPMLASTSASVAEALTDADGIASIEWKLDGARVQAHRRRGEVRLFTRNLNDVTDRLPGVVAVVQGLPGGDLVLDGEVMGTRADGAPRAFQDTVADFAAHATDDVDVPRGADLRAWFFDVMFADGRSLVDEPFSVRRAVLERLVGDEHRARSIVTSDIAEGERFFAATLAAGHEGVMVKRHDAAYEAGRRGAGWRKVKPVHTLDLVVLAVEWGSGRRRGWLSNIHLGARNDGSADVDAPFVMVGKTFKGMTDEILRWQTERFRSLQTDEGEVMPWERGRDVVRVRPEQVVEIAVDGVQRSTTYPGGVALRFARVRGYRHDKSADQADSITAVRAIGRTV
ncbi:MAG: ATP-dependent DNA ligase, partial [Actinomycetota bacterium]